MGVRLGLELSAPDGPLEMMRKTLGVATTAAVVAVAVAIAGWFVLAWVSGATLVTFRTGSMAPTMPQGAVAVTLPAAAAELQPGDVVTVQRADGALPITHRVVEVHAVAGAADASARELVLQGDANATRDAQPYVVTEVRRAVLAVPHLGAALMVLQSPIGMGALTLLAGALATWAFWPGRADAADAAEAGDAAEPATLARPA